GRALVQAQPRGLMTALDLSAPVPVPITKRGWFIRLVQLGVIAFFVVAWEVLGQLGVLDKFYYSRPSLFIARIAQWFGEGLGPTSIWNDMRVTLLETVLGFVIGTLLGVTIGYAFARNQLLGQAFDPLLSMFNAIPRLVLAPVFILAFGIDLASKVALGVTLVFFIVFFATFTAVRDVDQTLVDNVRVLGARRRAGSTRAETDEDRSARDRVRGHPARRRLRRRYGPAVAVRGRSGRGDHAAPSDRAGRDRLRRIPQLSVVGSRQGARLLRGREPRRDPELCVLRQRRRDRAAVGLGRLHRQLDGPVHQGADRGEADEDGRRVLAHARRRHRRPCRPQGHGEVAQGPQGQDRRRDLAGIWNARRSDVRVEPGRSHPGQGLHLQALRVGDHGRDPRLEGRRRMHQLRPLHHPVRGREQRFHPQGLPHHPGHDRAR